MNLLLRTLVGLVYCWSGVFVNSAYPKCQNILEIRTFWVTLPVDYPQESAITDCRNACRTQSTLAGVHRDGEGGNVVQCFCGDADVSLTTGCTHDCEGGQDNCGGVNVATVYTVCDPGWHNPDCSLPCPGVCADDVCDVNSGECNAECWQGYYGSYCNIMCGNCEADRCDKDSGVCEGGCDPGFYTPVCDTPCPSNCGLVTCHIDDGTCDGNCTSGWYGAQCDTPCPNCAADRCDRDNGICEGGCDPGWYRPGCNSPCSPNCAQTTCDIDDGTCDGGCESNWYGLQCDKPCPENCEPNLCYIDDGTCVVGCRDGWYGSYCNISCSTTCQPAMSLFPAHITICRNGFYGSDCGRTCPPNCELDVCNIHDGTCDVGCKEGWYGPRCDRACPIDCEGRCNQDTAFCVRCKPGFYGSTCHETCPSLCRQNVCDDHLGTPMCSYGCKDGFYGHRWCTQCPSQCVGNACDNDGSCQMGCVTGWTGKWCDTDVNECSDDSLNNCASMPTGYNKCYNTRGSYVCCENGLDVLANIFFASESEPHTPQTPVWVWPVLVLALLVGGTLGLILGAIIFRQNRQMPSSTKSHQINDNVGFGKEQEANDVNSDTSRAVYVIDNKHAYL